MAGLTRTLAHEMLHTWISHRIGSMPDEQSQASSEATEYWISEGFDDYYAQRMLVRAGVWSPAEFMDALNRVLAQYAASVIARLIKPRVAIANLLAEFQQTVQQAVPPSDAAGGQDARQRPSRSKGRT